MDMETYLNKVCRDTDNKSAAVNQPVEKKYCRDFVKGDDGYCINYTKPESLECTIELSNSEHKTVEVYTPALVNCSGQCKARQAMGIEKK